MDGKSQPTLLAGIGHRGTIQGNGVDIGHSPLGHSGPSVEIIIHPMALYD